MKNNSIGKVLVSLITTFVFLSSMCLAADITIKADPQIPASVVERAKIASQVTADFYERVYHVRLERPVEIVLVSSQEDFRKALIEVLKVSPENAEKFTKHNKGVSSWNIVSYYITEKSSDYGIYSHLAHEMTHTIQRQITGQPNPPGKMTWLWEGMANVLPAQIMEEQGIRTIADRRKAWISYTKKQTIRPDIKILFNQEEWFRAMDIYGVDNVYNVATVGVDYLVLKKGYNSLFDYVRTAKTAPDGTTAFSQAFGLSLDQFAVEFRGYLAEQLKQ